MIAINYSHDMHLGNLGSITLYQGEKARQGGIPPSFALQKPGQGDDNESMLAKSSI